MARATLKAFSPAARLRLANVCLSEYMSSDRTPARLSSFVQTSRRTFGGSGVDPRL